MAILDCIEDAVVKLDEQGNSIAMNRGSGK
jgi:hypothetical protein